MDEILDNKYLEFQNILFETKGILDLHKIISLNAEKVNTKKYNSIFWLIDRLAIKNYAINISMLFEKPNKRYPLNSIFGLLAYIKDEKISPLSPSMVGDYIRKNGVTVSFENDYVGGLQKVVDNFCDKYSISLERFKHVRDKKYAHSESIEEQIKDLPSYNEMEKIFVFCFEFIGVISRAYLNVVPHNISEDNRFSRNICKLLKDTGIENIETDFTD